MEAPRSGQAVFLNFWRTLY